MDLIPTALTFLDAALAVIFAAIAFVYASVGLGGGSAYTALLVIAQLPAAAIPTIALTLNLVVTTAGGFNFIRQGHTRARLILPFMISSLPTAYIGGSLKLDETAFRILLLISLTSLLPLLLLPKPKYSQRRIGHSTTLVVSIAIGALLGFLAGAAGIGGGIYLVPLIILLGLGSAQQAAASGALFIWFNSIAGLIARAQYHDVPWIQLSLYSLAVLIGGAAGSRLGATTFSARTLERMLGFVILLAVILLVKRLWL